MTLLGRVCVPVEITRAITMTLESACDAHRVAVLDSTHIAQPVPRQQLSISIRAEPG